MRQLKNWKIERSGGGLKISHDDRSYPTYGNLTRVKLVTIRDGKIIAVQSSINPGMSDVEYELLAPDKQSAELPAVVS